MNVSASVIVHCIQSLGLEVAPNNTVLLLLTTKCALFYSSRQLVLPVTINIMGNDIVSSDSIKYSGVILDRRLGFKVHFAYIERNADKTMRRLWKLMPNMGGSGEVKRKLYVKLSI